MKTELHLDVVRSCLKAGLTVVYIDKNSVRRGEVREIDSDCNKLKVMNGALAGYSSPHFNVLVLVNEQCFDEYHRKEFKNIPGYVSGTYPSYIYLGLP